MKKIRLFIIVSFTTALAVGILNLPTAHAAKPVKIGLVLPLSGSSGDIGKQIAVGAAIAADEINQRGGVAAIGGAKLELILGDTKTHPAFGVMETEYLIKNENVSVLCGAYNSFITLPATEVAERFKIPWVVNSSAADEITERGFKYVFRPCNTAYYDAREQMDAIAHFSQETGMRPVTIGQIYEATDWGRSHARNIRMLAKDRGYFLIVDEAYVPEESDFTSELSLVRQRQTDLLIVALYTPDHILFSQQYLKAQIHIPFGIHSVGAGSEDPVFYKNVPPAAAEYMFVQEDWQIDQLEEKGRVQILNREFKRQLGQNMNAYGAQGYSNVWIIYDALERSGSADREKIREALAKTRIVNGPALTPGYQKIAFDPKGQNLDAHGVVSQHQKGRRISLWPAANRLSGSKSVWPVPPWSRR